MSDLKPKPKRKKITGRRCCLPHCRKSKRDNANYRFFKFPEYDSPLFMQWVENCNLSEEFVSNSSSLILCQDHFAKAAIGKKFLKRGTLPEYFLSTKYQGAVSDSTESQDVDLSVLKSPARKRKRSDSPPDICRQCHKTIKDLKNVQQKYSVTKKRENVKKKQVIELKKENVNLRKEINRLKAKQKDSFDDYVKDINLNENEKIFIKMIVKDKNGTNTRWEISEKLFAQAIFYRSTSTYLFLRDSLHLHLPYTSGAI